MTLWREMMARKDAAIEGCEDLEDADHLSREASILTVRDWLFPDGDPPGPWNIEAHRIWQALTAEAAAAGRGE